MKTLRFFLTLFGALLLGISTLQALPGSEPKPAVQAKPAIAAIITECERATWEAFKNHDQAAYQALSCPEFYEISSSGSLHTLKDILESMKTLETKFYKMDEVVVTQLAENVCLIRYLITVQYSEDGKDEPVSKAHASAVWIKRADKWLVATYQETLLKP